MSKLGAFAASGGFRATYTFHGTWHPHGSYVTEVFCRDMINFLTYTHKLTLDAITYHVFFPTILSNMPGIYCVVCFQTLQLKIY